MVSDNTYMSRKALNQYVKILKKEWLPLRAREDAGEQLTEDEIQKRDQLEEQLDLLFYPQMTDEERAETRWYGVQINVLFIKEV